MKKVTSLILSVVLVACLFTGCEVDESKLSVIKPDALPKYEGKGTVSSLVEDDRNVTMIYSENSEEYDEYVELLLDNGFAKYAENQIGDNLFATLYNQVTTATVYFRPAAKELKIIAEPRGDLYPREKDNKYKSKDMQTLLTGFKGENVIAYSGMGIIIRLDDGSFIIIDGGGGDYDSVDSNKLLKILKEQSPKGTQKPVIAAWIFTHAHNDHIGVFNHFSDDFHDKVVIEGFYYNFPALRRVGRDVQNFYYHLENNYSEVPTVRPHTGEKYFIRNAVVEILYTHEDMYPDTYENGGYNDGNQASLIFTIDIEGQRIMITGDASTCGFEQTVMCFGDYLKSDIFQMSHHGQNGSVEFNSLVDPTYALLPIAHPVNERHYRKTAGNVWLVDSENVRQFLHFGKTSVTIPIPYNPTDEEIGDRMPDWTTNLPTYPTLKPKVVKAAKSVPEAWFDLGFENGKPIDKLGNLTVTMPKGTIGETKAYYDYTEYDITAFTGKGANEGLLVNLPFETKEEYSKFITDGFTFELFFQLEEYSYEYIVPEEEDIQSNNSLFGNANLGGVSLCCRDYDNMGQLQFVMNSTKMNAATNPWDSYVCAARRWMSEGPAYIEEGKVSHVVGTYDKKKNTLSIYYNGILASESSFGNGEFEVADEGYNVLGIGIDPTSYLKSFGEMSPFTVLGAKIYKTALSESEVLAEYNKCIKSLKK